MRAVAQGLAAGGFLETSHLKRFKKTIHFEEGVEGCRRKRGYGEVLRVKSLREKRNQQAEGGKGNGGHKFYHPDSVFHTVSPEG